MNRITTIPPYALVPNLEISFQDNIFTMEDLSEYNQGVTKYYQMTIVEAEALKEYLNTIDFTKLGD